MEDPGVRCPRCNYKTHGKGATQKWTLNLGGRCPAQGRKCKECGKTGHLTNSRNCSGKKLATKIVGKQKQGHKARTTATATVTVTKGKAEESVLTRAQGLDAEDPQKTGREKPNVGKHRGQGGGERRGRHQQGDQGGGGRPGRGDRRGRHQQGGGDRHGRRDRRGLHQQGGQGGGNRH